jgi:hypothetical protein
MSDKSSTPPPIRPGWFLLKPTKAPEPSIWPATMALATTLLFWGLVTSLLITGIGSLLFTAALTGWIRDIRHERNRD